MGGNERLGRISIFGFPALKSRGIQRFVYRNDTEANGRIQTRLSPGASICVWNTGIRGLVGPELHAVESSGPDF